MSTWRELISEEMKTNNECWADVVLANIQLADRWYVDAEDDDRKPASFDKEFDSGYGGENGDDFLVWTSRFVYFPVCYDGSEWCGSALRYPEPGQVKGHSGGG